MVSWTEIQWAYRALLGREPESQSVLDHHSTHENFESLCRVLATSPEGVAYLRRQIIPGITNLPFQYDCPVTVFIHIPKTGGTALYHWLTRAYALLKKNFAQINDLSYYSIAELNQFDFLSGHFNYGMALAIPREHKTIITCFRDPSERLISLYRFYRSHPLGSGGSKLLDLARHLSPEKFFWHDDVRVSHETDNYYLRTFSDYDGLSGGGRLSRGASVQQAISRIASLKAVAITENMTTSARTIADVLDLDLPDPPEKLHVTANFHRVLPGFDPAVDIAENAELSAALNELTRYDREIYNYAKSLQRT